QKQRVSLAGVMVDDVPIFLFDEPLANLDPAAGKAAIELIDEIQKSSGATVIIIEHRLEDVLHRPVDRVVLMNEGRIVSDSSPDALLSGRLLFENGIREPLYLSALKTAGVRISEDKRPSSLDTIALSEDDKEKLREWFCAAPSPAAKKERQVLLSVKDLGFSYSNGRRALDDISLEVYKGEMLAVVGRNGAGKSTLSKLICGFEKPCEGSISLDGADLSGLSIKERAERIGYVMQNPNQMICKTMIYDETALGLVTRGVPEDEIKERVGAALKTCGLYPFRNWPVSALSFGQKKRLTIASILAIGPEIIILDEPTAGQDYRHYTEIMEFLRELAARGITVIMITHDMHLMLEYCERTLVLTDGRLIADDEPWNILTDQSVIEAADLKETSLCGLARLCGIGDGRAFTASFIDGERRQRHGQHI
ncbi:MAG: DUF3744 domain-containing protein, partial [Firmicutes bacterium]|nr:DUF3744 domain-containing protein [Bacillota bacterium]